MYAAIPATPVPRGTRAAAVGSVRGKVAKLDCPGFIPGRTYKSRGELSSSKQDRSQKAPTSRTTSSVGAEKQLYSAWGPWATIPEAHTESSSSAGHLTLPDILTSSVLVSGLTYGILHLTMPATHSRRCALPGRDLSSSTTTRAGLRSARRAPSDRERIRHGPHPVVHPRAPLRRQPARGPFPLFQLHF